MNKDSAVDVAVVGGGLAGLTAAAYLARAGKRVVVFEQGKKLGGRASTQEKRSFMFNLGAHALYQRSVGAEILAELGVRYAGSAPSQRGLFVQIAGDVHPMPSGPISLLTSKFLAGGRLEAAKLFLTLPRHAPSDMSAAQWLARIRAEPVRQLFAGMFRLVSYAADLDALSVAAVFPYLRLAMQGKVLYLDGGWQTLVDGLQSVAESAGARIETSARVEFVSSRAGGAVEVRVAPNRSVRAGAVIIAAGPGDAARLVGDSAALHEWARRAEPVHAACLDVALRELPDANRSFLLGLDRPVYVSVHSPPAVLAPPGAALVHALKYNAAARSDAASGAASDPATDRSELEAAMDALQPGWRDRVEHVRFLPRMVVCNALVRADQGGIGARPGPAVPDAPGVYVAGDWVGDAGMLADAALASARTAALALTK